jgi:hypothetical protein
MAQNQGSAQRTENWGLPMGRVLPTTVNSGIVRATTAHRPLLAAWDRLLAHPLYLQAQAQAWYTRPPHMLGDQDVLTALLGSAHFSDVPLQLLRRGRDIAQCFGPAGFTVGERLASLAHGAPALIHAMGPKPWAPAKGTGGGLAARIGTTYRRMDAELSPYARAAAELQDRLGAPARWTSPSTPLARAMAALAGRHIALQGLPLAAIDQIARRLKRMMKSSVISYHDAYRLVVDPLAADHPANKEPMA